MNGKREAGKEEAEDEEWWVRLPKIELHAHLNGSIRDSTLLELARGLAEKGSVDFPDVESAILKEDRTLIEVFKLFEVIRMVTTNHETITRITTEVIEDFASENVVYLELRTTPKRNDSVGMSKRSYMEAVLEGIRAVHAVDVNLNFSIRGNANQTPPNNASCKPTGKKIYVGLLLSIDRRETTEAAMETVNLALEMRDVGVVGIDLSGNPTVGEWVTFLPALKLAKEQGLPITLHCGEVPNHEEIQAMLNFLPQRVGHACCFNEEEWIQLKSSKLPVEICLTSNIRTETISSLDIHHFVDLYNSSHPLILCTDDFGVFSTSLSNEYIIASSAFGLGKKEMFQLARNGVELIFAGEEVKRDLADIFESAAKEFGFGL